MQLTLTSSDEKSFQVDREILKHAGTIENLISSMGLEDADAPMPIPLPNVKGTTLGMIINWLNLHKDDPVMREEKEDRNLEDISEEDKAFLQGKDQATIFDLILGANYLDINGLLEVTTKTVANMIKGKTHEQIREKFGIKNDFTSEEEEQIRKENAWCEE